MSPIPFRKSWLFVDEKSDFPLYNIPFGIFSTETREPRVASIIGDWVIDLSVLAELGYIKAAPVQVYQQKSLNPFIALGKNFTSQVRNQIMELFAEGNEKLKNNEADRQLILVPVHDVTLHLPVEIGDYTDFYSSKEHATNVGTMFRDPNNALLPNWLHLPVGYHGRASSIVVSGTNIYRPQGQMKPQPELPPVFGATKQLDFELEVAFVVGKPTAMGDTLSTAEAESYIFGLALFNDWSARDIQSWEYVPLGPFLGKNFASTLSPWIVTLEALEFLRVDGPSQEPQVLDYLSYEGKKSYDITLEVYLGAEGKEEQRICKSNFKYMYWTMVQQLAHHTVNGCNLRVGDLCASGTISGPSPESYGSMLELCWRGTKPILLSDGSSRKFIEDNDRITMKGFGEKDGMRIGFGSCTGVVLPLKEK